MFTWKWGGVVVLGVLFKTNYFLFASYLHSNATPCFKGFETTTDPPSNCENTF